MTTLVNSAYLVPLLSIVLSAVVLFRLVRNGLYTKYPYFCLFLAFSIFRLIVLQLPLSRYLYGVFWMATESLVWVFYVLILLELYTLVLSRYKGIQTLSKWIFHVSVTLAISVAAISIYPRIGSSAENDFLMVFFIAERGILSALALMTLLMTAFLTWFPVPLPRNVILHSLLFGFYFFSKAAALLIRHMFGHQGTKGGTTFAILAVGWICLLLWAWLMTPAGEEVETRLGHRWNEDEEEKLLDQLKSINSSLSRSAQG